MLVGRIKQFDWIEGFGYIELPDGRQAYVREKDMPRWGVGFSVGDVVEFELIEGPQGLRAKRVKHASSETGPGGLAGGSQATSRPKTVSVPSTTKPKQSSARRKSEATSRPPDGKAQARNDYLQALVARQNREYDRARQLFEKAIARSPNRNFFDAYARMEKELRQFDRARRIYKRAIEYFPEAGSFYEGYGMLVRHEGRLQEAADTFRQGLERAPDHKALHRCLAQVLVEMEDDSLLKEAETHFELARQQGVLPPNDLRYQKLKMLQGHPRAHLTVRFLEQAGFEATWFYVHGKGFAGDMVFQPRRPEYREAYDLTGEVFVRCFYHDEVSYQSIEGAIKRVHTADIKRPLNRDVLFIALKSVAPMRDALYRLQEKVYEEDRQPYPTVVPLEEAELQRGLEAGDCEGILRQVLDQWLYRRNLYDDRFPVSGRRFFGREEELATLVRNIDNGQHTGVFGLRKVGKTSLLYHLREKRPRDLSAYVDLQAVPAGVRDCTYLYWSAANEWRKQLEAKYPHLAKDLPFRLAGRYRGYADLPEATLVAVAFDSDLRLLRETLAQHEETGQVKALLLLDEIELILPRQGQAGWAGYIDFLTYLRGTAQQTGFLVSVVTAANPRLCEEPQFVGLDNPVFQFYQEMYLPPLEWHECFEMVEKLGKGMGLTYDPAALQRIYDETGGHPSITRRLCSRLAARFPERPLEVEEAKVEVAAEEFLFHDESIFREILERLDRDFPTEKELLLAIARGTMDSAELSALVPTGLAEALRHLVGYQLVTRTNGAYRVKIRLLDRWLRRRWLGLED